MNSQHTSRINDVIFYIHQDISRELPAAKLAEIAAYSEQHFHRIFKQTVGESVHQYIRRTRMEYAANQLMFDITSPVLDIGHQCGFNSLSSFSRAFKATFGMSPGAWRKHDIQHNQRPYLKNAEIAEGYTRVAKRGIPSPKVLDLQPRQVAYVRHTGYDRSIKNAWLLLKTWANAEQRSFSVQYGLHHSNPAWVALEKCRYVACIEIDRPVQCRSVVNQLTIPGGPHAVFRLHGRYGELLPQISLILEQWLPASGLKMAATPAYVHYLQNHFLAADELFELDFCLPLQF
ncbi:Transposon Tn10 TetD protein [Vibrio aerogenes CECT 7868]|uniref:Transposon Tn10 TetD protein n=1 Tax=Vibrio aerogenes CECT 7868 TaxID=1216006 RepID=A0A1M6ED12_9VIBR|nr:AraC family transcriptional regulator [Vibrio aerogenes]SHI83313.1 Transposon Tn10 TetD protein [Vibrio aerogenes CECT 7868]